MALKTSALSFYFLILCFVVGTCHPISHPEENGPFFQGDIILRSILSGRLDKKYRWQNRTIHYEFEPNYPSELKRTFDSALNHISERTCLVFKQRENSTDIFRNDYVYVFSGSACYSHVGRQTGKQLISLPQACNYFGTFVHELLHTIGFHHEQSRTDRDKYVKILWENVQTGKENQFKKYDAATVTSFGIPYDYESILHYNSWAYSKSPSSPTIVPLKPGKIIGQRSGMSDKDIAKVNKMYECE